MTVTVTDLRSQCLLKKALLLLIFVDDTEIMYDRTTDESVIRNIQEDLD